MHLLSVFSLRNRALIALVTVVVAVFGGIALTSLKQELAPSIQFPQLAVVTSYPGASPAVVDADVSTPIETAIQGVPGIDTTSATSSTENSLVTASFVYGTDLDTAEQKMDQAISRISSTLPDGLDPQVVAGSIDDLPVLAVAATGDDTDALADQLDRTTLPDLRKVDGVRDAQLLGALGKRVTITPDETKLADAGLSDQAITSALQQNGVLVGAGTLTENGRTLAVQSGSKLDSVDQIAALPLVATSSSSGSGSAGSASGSSSGAGSASGSGSAAGSGASGAASGGSSGAAGSAGSGSSSGSGSAAASGPLDVHTIADVATVAEAQDPRTSISRVNGRDALTISITKLPAANTVEVSQAVRDRLDTIESGLGDGARLTVVFDQAPFIEESISSLAEEGLLGLVFAVIVILVFLLSIRSTLITAISIPTSVLITFIGMQAANYTLNIITLGALTIAIGRVVDDSIVVTENIKRHLGSGGDRVGVIQSAVREVAGAVTASTATTVAVFLPLAFVSGTTGELFRPFALTVTIALVASLFVSLTIVPVLAYWFLRSAHPSKHAPAVDDEASDELEHPSRLQRGYLPIVRWVTRHSIATVALAVLVLAGTGATVPLLKTNFLGGSGQNTFSVTQELTSSDSLDTQDDKSKRVESVLRDTAGVETVQLTIGSSGSAVRDAFFGGGSGTITYNVTTDRSYDQEALQLRVRHRLDDLRNEGQLTVAASSGFGASTDIEVDITANTAAELQDASDAVLKKVRALDVISQASSNLSSSQPYLAVTVDRTKAAQAGLSEVALGRLVAQATEPTSIGQVTIDESTQQVYVQSSDPPTTRDELAALSIPTVTGDQRLDALATVAETNGPATITSERGLRSATITATPSSDDTGTASTQVQTAVDAVDLPRSAEAVLGGVTATQSDSFAQLGLALLIAILIVYVVMVATFRSLLQPLLLLVSIPFAATGAILLQLATGIPLGVASLVGVLMLVGIVVTNAIVLIDLVNQYRRRGMPVRLALEHGASRRLRPILMTALATIFALLPLAAGITGRGGFISQPLALVVIGGLLSSTVLTLVVLPALYSLVEGGRERRRARRAARRAGAEQPVAEPLVAAGGDHSAAL